MERSVQPGETLLGKYVVERVLGRGGMGIVLAARHVELGQTFAIKLLLPRTLESADAGQRFAREARAAAQLRSEHVARVLDVGSLDDGAPYMVMEYLDGSDLAAVLRARGPLPAEEAITYVLQACEAITEAHALGIVHRDLKPANLFLTRRINGSPCVKVLDFGISKHTQADVLELTQTGAVLGSPQYMAPEQVRSTRAADARSDIWSMGVVLYKLVTGVHPFQGEAAHEIIAAVLEDEPPAPSTVRPGLPIELDAVLARALRKKPDQRFQRVDELAAALRAVAGISSTTVRIPAAAKVAAAQPPPEPTAPTLGGASFDAARSLQRRNHRLTLAFATAGIAAVLMLVAGFLLGRRWGAGPAGGAAAGAPETAVPPSTEGPAPAGPAAHSSSSVPAAASESPPAPASTGGPAPSAIPSAEPAAAPTAPARPAKWGARAPAAAPSNTTAPTVAATAAPRPRTIF